MDKKTLAILHQQLKDEEQRLLQELANTSGQEGKVPAGGTTPHFPQYGSKDDENAAEVATFSDRLSVSGKITEALSDVRRALRCMEDGTYGTCRYCQKPIPEQRLLARPASGACVQCKEELKRSEENS